jgi:hypothetical protein
MNIDRSVLKQQISAARAVIVGIRTRSLRSANAATDWQQLDDALARLTACTEALARQVYASDAPISPTPWSNP